jgi:hypothetical protein
VEAGCSCCQAIFTAETQRAQRKNQKKGIHRKGAKDAKKQRLQKTHIHPEPETVPDVFTIIFSLRSLRLCGDILFSSASSASLR